jgi:hypothetical protein
MQSGVIGEVKAYHVSHDGKSLVTVSIDEGKVTLVSRVE